MNSSFKKKKDSFSQCISNVETAKTKKKGDGALKKSKTVKKINWTSEALLKQMEPVSSELQYREEKGKFSNLTKKYSRYFKCTKCQLNFKDLTENVGKIAVHPFLKVLFCQECLDFYEDGEFSVDSDGEEKYCRWCGEGGLMYSCSKCNCGFCATCIKKHLGAKYRAQVIKDNEWKCFICNPEPLWFLRFVCSIVEEEAKHKNLPFKANSKCSPSLSPKLETELGSEAENSESKSTGNVELKDEENANLSSTTTENTMKLEEDETITNTLLGTPALKRGIKRKVMRYSSSDESDVVSKKVVKQTQEDESDVVSKKVVKQTQDDEGSVSNSGKKSGSEKFVNSEIIDKVEKILKLAEYQLGFGVNWSSNMLTKLLKPNSSNSVEELKNDCQKIKWFFSILSTYLVESCSSIDSIIKSMENNEDKIVINSPEKNQEGDYSTVVKFLDFVTNQVKVFLEKGICLQDLLEGEIYYDKEIIGVKVKSNPAPSTLSESQTFTPNSKVNNESYLSDSKCINEEKTSDENVVPTLELETDNDFISDTEGNKSLNLSNSNTDYIEDAESQKSKILEIMSILENA